MEKNILAKNATPVKTESKRNLRKEIEARSRARRMRSIMKHGMSKEDVEKMFAEENNRMVLVLLNGNFTIEAGTKEKEIVKRGKNHKIISKETIVVPVILRGVDAAKKYIEDNKLNILCNSKNAVWILTNKDHVDAVTETVRVLGRVSVTKPEQHTYDTEKARLKKEAKSKKKPTNNTTETKKTAKVERKAKKVECANMRPYYAALRKGGVSERIKKHNPTLAKKIEKWLKERKEAEAAKADVIDKHKRDHRQMSSIEMKANKRARKAKKLLAAQERRRELEKKRAEYNATVRAKRTQKAQKPVQTELKMAA